MLSILTSTQTSYTQEYKNCVCVHTHVNACVYTEIYNKPFKHIKNLVHRTIILQEKLQTF